jgi:hypothetical protein
MSWSSSIMDPCIGIGRRPCSAVVRIRKLKCVQMQIVERLGLVADRRTQEPAPERAQMLPSRVQVLVAMIGYASHVAQSKLCYHARNSRRHREEGSGKTGVQSGAVAGYEKGIPCQLDSGLAPKQARRAGRSAVPRRIALRAAPPLNVPELEVHEQKRTLTCPLARGSIQAQPQITVHPHHLRQRMPIALSGNVSHLLNKQLVEFMNELEARVDGLMRNRH